MSGLMQRYNESLKNTGKPIILSELPPMKIDYKAMTEYARSKGTRPSKLSEQEKNLFVSK